MAWRPAYSLVTIRDQVNSMWPSRSRASDGFIGDAAHAAVVSDHNPNAAGVVTAFDITHDPASGADMQIIANALFDNQDGRVKYVIWNRRIWVPPYHAWQAYNGTADPHTNHLHLSVSALPYLYDDGQRWNLTQEDDMPTIATKDMVDSLAHAYLDDSYDNNPGLAQYVGMPVETVINAFNGADQRGRYLKSIDNLRGAVQSSQAQKLADDRTIQNLTAQLAAKTGTTEAAIKAATKTAPSATKSNWFTKLVAALTKK